MKTLHHAARALLFASVILMPLWLNAQTKDWYDSLEMKHQKKVRIHRTDTTPYYRPHVTVTMFNPFYENPGFCGFEQRYTFNGAFNYKIPFFKTEDGMYHPYNYFASFDCSLGKNGLIGLGACFYDLRSGAEIMSVMNYSYSFKFHFGKYNNLRIGFSIEYFEHKWDYNISTFPDMISCSNGFVYQTAEQLAGVPTNRNFNFNYGMSFSRKHFYAGLSVRNIFKPDIGVVSLERMPRQIMFSSGYTFILSRKVELSPSAQFSFIRKECTGNVHLTGVFWKHFIAGLSLNELTTASVDLGCSFWDMLTFYASCGISTQSELYYHFGPLDYVSANLRFQIGKYKQKS